jgi:hypothetical protein
MSSTNRGRSRERSDTYPTPSWCVRRILEAVPLPAYGAWLEPCAGEGAIIKAVQKFQPQHAAYWHAVEIRPEAVEALAKIQNVQQYHSDFLKRDTRLPPWCWTYHVCLTNPPFSFALEFAQGCREICEHTILLLRLNFLASAERAEFMRETKPDVYVLPNRPSFTLGGKTDSIEYAWFHWHQNSQGLVRVLPTTSKEERKNG